MPPADYQPIDFRGNGPGWGGPARIGANKEHPNLRNPAKHDPLGDETVRPPKPNKHREKAKATLAEIRQDQEEKPKRGYTKRRASPPPDDPEIDTEAVGKEGHITKNTHYEDGASDETIAKEMRGILRKIAKTSKYEMVRLNAADKLLSRVEDPRVQRNLNVVDNISNLDDDELAAREQEIARKLRKTAEGAAKASGKGKLSGVVH